MKLKNLELCVSCVSYVSYTLCVCILPFHIARATWDTSQHTHRSQTEKGRDQER